MDDLNYHQNSGIPEKKNDGISFAIFGGRGFPSAVSSLTPPDHAGTKKAADRSGWRFQSSR